MNENSDAINSVAKPDINAATRPDAKLANLSKPTVQRPNRSRLEFDLENERTPPVDGLQALSVPAAANEPSFTLPVAGQNI